MLGNHGGETFDESEENGGPFCMSFHKSEGHPWDYSCDANDADHLEGFIQWALSEFPIDPNAVFLHGFSSGAIMTSNLMMASCRVERLISAAAPYAGLINAAPTTKAAFLVIHGTHDNVVPYREDWIGTGEFKSRPSCECDPNFGSSCFYDNYIDLKGPTLAASIAIVRGYSGDVFQNYPEKSGTLDLVVNDVSRCQETINKCTNPFETPNPWNAGWDCNNWATAETDVIEFPTTEDSGPVVLWSINMHNHDYPNMRRSSGGPTEVFFQLRSFFNANRGLRSSPSYKVEQMSEMFVCANPGDFDGYTPPESFFRYEPTLTWTPMTPARCKEYCENDFRCTDAFYVDYSQYGLRPMCKIFMEPYPCLATRYSYYPAVHFKATGEIVPTSSPTANPTAPTGSPTANPTRPQTEAPTPPLQRSFCENGEELQADNNAGFSCNNGRDSNEGYTEAECINDGGTWTSYDCGVAHDYYQTAPVDYLDYFTEWWQPKCCVGDAPTASPTGSSTISDGCPNKCTVPTCIGLGTDGPGWKDEWSRDEDAVPTENGFCTKYCKVYDDTTGAALCGDGDWHKSGTDCTGCTSIAQNPIIPEEDREESSGLCAAIEELSGHALWGTGVKECGNGQEPTNDSRCTIWQSMNGDGVLNPERTCRGFCSSFGLQCKNGYDDGENGCLYGGEGIGCDSILGCCSDGGPTPDHVCVCVEPTLTPSSNPSSDPSQVFSSSPSMLPSGMPSQLSNSPSMNPTFLPTTMPSTATTESPTIECINSSAKINWKGKPWSCAKIRKNWCKRGSFKKHCPLKCDTCAASKCVDSTAAFHVSKDLTETFSCKKLKKDLTRQKRKKLCRKNQKVISSCRKTCKYCD